MLETRKYNMVVEAKNAIFDFTLETDNFVYWEDAIPVIRRTMNAKMPILEKQALATVLESGTFTNGHGFLIPPTSCCCENFKQVCRDMKKKRQIYILVCDPYDPRADADGYFSVGIF